jgi:hypothetical protein
VVCLSHCEIAQVAGQDAPPDVAFQAGQAPRAIEEAIIGLFIELVFIATFTQRFFGAE